MKVLTWIAGLSATALMVTGGFFLVTTIMPTLFPSKPSEVSVPAMPAPEIKRAPTKAVTIKQPLKVFAGDTKFKLKLPAAVQKNEAEHVLAATQVKGSDRPQTITTVVNEETGQSQTFVKTDPYPWLAFENRAEVRMAYGYRYDFRGGLGVQAGKQVGRLSFTYDALRVKALTAGVVAQVDTDGQAFVGVGVGYRW